MESVFTMVVLIVLISCGAGVINNYLKNQRSNKADVSDEVQAELDRLRERVEVLEKIVTDEKFHLARELNQLERQA